MLAPQTGYISYKAIIEIHLALVESVLCTRRSKLQEKQLQISHIDGEYNVDDKGNDEDDDGDVHDVDDYGHLVSRTLSCSAFANQNWLFVSRANWR